MQTFEILFAVTTFLLIATSTFLPKRKGIQFRCFQLGMVFFLLHWIFEDIRWQMIFCYGMFFIASVFLIRERSIHLAIRLAGFFIGFLFLSISIFYSVTMPILKWPKPTGVLEVGNTNFTLVDHNRLEKHSILSDKNREIFVDVWYPAISDPDMRPMSLWPELYGGDRDIVDFLFGYLKKVETYSYWEVRPDSTNGPFPIVVFNHGLQMFTSQNTVLVEELVSHGYVVMSISHPYESLRVNLGSESIIPPFLTSMEKFGEAMKWIEETSGPILTARNQMNGANTLEEKSNIMLQAIESSPMNEMVDYWVKDNLLVLDYIMSDQSGDLLFKSIVDTTAVGIMGMSIGGATAVEVAKIDHRVKAAINIDGLQYGTRNHLPMQKPLFMLYSQDGSMNNEFLKLASTDAYHEVTFTNARHVDFTDLPRVWPTLHYYGQTGSIEVTDLSKTLSTMVLEYWNFYLKESGDLEWNSNRFPEAKLYSKNHLKDEKDIQGFR